MKLQITFCINICYIYIFIIDVNTVSLVFHRVPGNSRFSIVLYMYNMCKLFTDKHSILQHDISIHGMCELQWQHDDVDEAWPGVVPATVYANGG